MHWTENEKYFDHKLKGYDKNLYLFWNREIQRWVIQRVSEIIGGSHHILTIQTPEGGYRAPQPEDFHKLISMDWAGKDPKLLTQMIDESNNKNEEKILGEITEINKYYAPLVKKVME